MPLNMSAPSGANLSFVYGPEHQRSKLIANSGITIYLNPDQSGGLLFEKETKLNGTVEYRNFITAAGQVIAVAKQKFVGGASTISYLHRDNMGSTTAVTNESGVVLERLAYEPYGKRRFLAGNTDSNNNMTGVNTTRGYTNHEHLEALGLIHMNGRVYDPALGRFMSADPMIQATDNLQSYNRYSYVMNTPFMYTDPTGFSAWTDFRDKWARPIAGIAIGMLLAPSGPSMFGFSNWMFGSEMATSIAAGGIAGAVASGNSQGFIQGALSAGLFYGAGSIADSWAGNAFSGTFERTVTHAVAGCVSAAASGGACGSGALAAGFSEGAGGNLPKLGMEGDLVKHAVIGGVGSVLGGGKFANGAVTGAFGYLFNELLHEGSSVEALTRSGYTLEGINLPGVGNTYLDPRMATAVNNWMELSSTQGVDIKFNSAFRVNGVPVSGAVFTPAGDGSLHNAGLAVDIRYDKLTNIPGGLTGDKQREILRSTASKAGLSWGGSFGDRVHFFIDPFGKPGPFRKSLIQTQQEAYRLLKK